MDKMSNLLPLFSLFFLFSLSLSLLSISTSNQPLSSISSHLVKGQLVLDGLDGVPRSPDAVRRRDLDDLELVLEEMALLCFWGC